MNFWKGVWYFTEVILKNIKKSIVQVLVECKRFSQEVGLETANVLADFNFSQHLAAAGLLPAPLHLSHLPFPPFPPITSHTSSAHIYQAFWIHLDGSGTLLAAIAPSSEQ